MTSLDTRSDQLSHMLPTPATPPMPTYVQVNIGRNVGGNPYSPAQWAAFQGEVQYAMHQAGALHVDTHTGRGSWTDEHGITISEESAYLSAFGVLDLPALRAALRVIKGRFEQDAIALIVGSELI